MKLNIKSRKGFTLIELLVVIGILAVLAAIAIPSVAGLIDRANVSADKTNSNEMTNAIERFASEYELYCQDIASGALDENNLDSAQGRVKNVVGVTTRAGISAIEVAQDATVTDNVIAIYRDTKYPANAKTMQLVVQNYTKTSSSTFEPKQSDMHFWYSPDCGVVVVAEPTKTAAELDKYVISGMDAKGNDITSNSVNAQWIDMTVYTSNENNNVSDSNQIIPEGASLDLTYYVITCPGCGLIQRPRTSENCPECTCVWFNNDTEERIVLTSGDKFPDISFLSNSHALYINDSEYQYYNNFGPQWYVIYHDWSSIPEDIYNNDETILKSIAGLPVFRG